MQKEFSLSTEKAMINFTAKYCDTSEKLIESYGFKKVLKTYISKIKNKNSNIYKYLHSSVDGESVEETISNIISVFKVLTVLDVEEIVKLNCKYEKLLTEKDTFIHFIEDLYSLWRKTERYTIIHNNKKGSGLQTVNFIDANTNFTQLILSTYRKVEENVLGYRPKVYRQLPVGGNAGLIVTNLNWIFSEEYDQLKDIPFIESILVDPPFITYPKKNTRDGMFEEVFSNPVLDCEVNDEHFFCYPAKVGELLAYIFFHRDFMAHGVTLCNLFEMAKEDECRNKKPDIIYVFGGKDDSDKVKTVFFDDKKNDIMVGYVSYNEDIDYFGYMKKMTLTLHNLIMIKRGFLPIHGAMVNIIMKDGNEANVVIMGDSGAGKSESLEALRKLSEDYITDMTVIFDDMGIMKINPEGKPLGFGTEVGAFVRLDDLDAGYAFKEMDRSIFMNPDKINARLVMPVASYKDIIKGYPVDIFLYANNYEDGVELEFFSGNVEEAIKLFKSGARMAKGTTTEKGLVESYFANPFGPAQKQKETDILIDEYFNDFFQTGVKVGQLRTCLGINGKEKTGPEKAALKLLHVIREI